jgi:hypothetical protein
MRGAAMTSGPDMRRSRPCANCSSTELEDRPAPSCRIRTGLRSEQALASALVALGRSLGTADARRRHRDPRAGASSGAGGLRPRSGGIPGRRPRSADAFERLAEWIHTKTPLA